jgi:two-component system, NarL family, sensor histidine kinase UhpB
MLEMMRFARHPRENIIRAPGDIAVRSPAPWRPRILNAVWFGRSVRAQLLIVFIMIEAIAALVAGSVTIFKAGAATRIEIAASMRLAEVMVNEAV